MKPFKIEKAITQRESPSFQVYLHEINQVDLIDAQEEVRLAQLIKLGDQFALEKLIEANLRFVVSVAKQYQNKGLSLQDLINEGNLGLTKAATRFDETRGFKFISYAVWWIRQSILMALSDNSRIVRIPLNKVGLISKIGKGISKLEQMYEREPTDQEIAEFVKVSSSDIAKVVMHNADIIRLDNVITQENDNTFHDVVFDKDQELPDSGLDIESLRKDINRALSTLDDEREKKVLVLYFGLNGVKSLTLEEIAAIFDLTRERVRQIKEAALKQLRKPKRKKLLRLH